MTDKYGITECLKMENWGSALLVLTKREQLSVICKNIKHWAVVAKQGIVCSEMDVLEKNNETLLKLMLKSQYSSIQS